MYRDELAAGWTGAETAGQQRARPPQGTITAGATSAIVLAGRVGLGREAKKERSTKGRVHSARL
jgi:glutamate/tyrosine decarboxylase-like PLP-dependent enzyme